MNAVKLQCLVYYEVRHRFDLSSNLAQQVCRRVAGNRKTAKQKNRPVKQFNPTSASYDARIFTFFEKDWSVSLTLVGGRERISLDIGNYQRGMLKGSKPTGATLVKRQDGSFYLQICLEREVPEPTEANTVIGVDLGRTDIVVTSTGEHFAGEDVNCVRDKFARVRASLQRKASKGTRSSRRRARQVLQRLSGRERRFATQVNHTIAHRLVKTAKTSSSAIALEELSGIRERTNQLPRTKIERRRSNSWSFYQLRQFIHYRCVRDGVKLQLINPRYTSQTCHQCLHIHPEQGQSYRSGKRFVCGHCGWHGDADLNGAINIARLGATVDTPRGSGLACSLSGQVSGLPKACAIPLAVSLG